MKEKLGKITGIFSKRLLIIIGGVLYLAFMTYILLPSNLPKPFYIEVSWDGSSAAAAAEESGPTPTPTVALAQPPEALPSEYSALLQGRGVMFPIGPKIYNLADKDARRYVKISLVLEILPHDMAFYTLPQAERALAEEKYTQEMRTKEPLIEDALTTALTSKTYEEVFTVKGKGNLKKEIMEAINPLMGVEEVAHIYFTEFLIQ